MGKIEEMRELIDILNRASYAYYNTGHTIMSDSEFDSLMERLKSLEKETGITMSNSPTVNVGALVGDKITKVTHTHPMLSLDKCHTVKGIEDFIGDDKWFASVKCDGLSTRLTYENGKLVAAETRGNGYVGNDVLFHVMQYDNVPKQIPWTGPYVIDGESVILKDDFEKINANLPEDEKFKNPRNLAAGTLGGLDANVTKQRHMKFFAWRVISGARDYYHQTDELFHAQDMGFDLAPIVSSPRKTDIQWAIDSMKEISTRIGLPMDGVVFTKDDNRVFESMGRTEKFFRGSIAYKFADETYETRLKYIDWTLGRSGVLTPTAVFDPVEIDGTTVERASVHNVTILRGFGLTNNCTVYIKKANLIIPQVDSCEDDGDGEIEIPTVCPICGGVTEIRRLNDSDELVCTNPYCSGKKLGSFAHFVSKAGMDIKGLSESTLELLISNGIINDFVDIYRLSGKRVQLLKLPRMGRKSVENLLDSIKKSRNVTLDHFITALGIPNIGSSAAKSIAEYCHGDFNEFTNAFATRFDWSILKDFGDIMSMSIDEYLRENFGEVVELANEMNFMVEEKNTVADSIFKGKNICITGSLEVFKNRNELVSAIEAVGGHVVSSVTGKTDLS